MIVQPSEIIGPVTDPYMLRWHIIRIGKLPRLYLHWFHRSDEDRALHDHPWSWFISFLIKGSYREIRRDGPHIRRAPSIAFRRGVDHHRIELLDNKPWTLFLTGRVVRKWGFWCDEHFVLAREFDGCE
jgi:hypothetical protein